MLILDVERLTGMDRATIRFYEKEKIIVPARAENGYRFYSDEEIQILLKVKLLRQLGFSLWKIKELQKGNVDFSAVLTEQIKTLENQIQENTTAMLVCKQIQKDSAQYSTLDVQYYLQMYSARRTQEELCFSEGIDREYHPWRRYIARFLDYQWIGALLLVLLVTILRIRPFTSMALDVVSYVANFLAVPVLAIFLHYVGTTPGKWAMGIRLESINGGKLSGGEALYREGKIIWHGLGLFIPVVNVFFLHRSYQREKEGKPQPWNDDTEVIYTSWNWKKKLIAILLFVTAFTVSVLTGLETVMPTYRGNGITIAEFAENHRDYEKTVGAESEYILGDDGKWKERVPSDTLYYIFDDPNDIIRPEFQFECNEFGEIRSITYENSWKNVETQRVLPFYCEAAIYTVIGSRPKCSFLDYETIAERLETDLYRRLSVQLREGEGSFVVKDVMISWNTEIENCDYIENGIMFAKDDAPISFNLKLKISII